MVHNCAILSCPLHNRRNIRKGLLFHSFPVDQHRFELWRQTVFHHCSQTLSINKHSKICYRHFHADDYIANQTGLTRYLKATAIPTIFAETSPHSIVHPSTTRNNHLLPSSIPLNNSPAMKFNSFSETISASSISISTITDTKARRLLNTIDKLHQIQNATNAVGIPQKIPLENESIKQDVDEQKHIPESSSLHISSIKDHDHLSPNNSFQISQSFTIDHSPTSKDSQSIQETFPRSTPESDLYPWNENTLLSLPKTALEDALFQFLKQANLLQYYFAFIEQGGDDLKQLADAENDDFQEIITLVGMASKPLHVKRFKKALEDYRLSINESYSTISLGRLSTEETFSDRHVFPSLLHSTATNNPSKIINSTSSKWLLNKVEHGKSNNTHQLLDDNQRKMIADEAERLANLLPVTTMKKPHARNLISKDLFATMNLPRDFEDRWQRIRKYSAIYNRFDSTKPHEVLSLHEILINEAAAAMCFHRPEFLTRRDELLHLARRVLQNIGISTSSIQKRPLSMLTCDVTSSKQIKLNIPLSKPQGRQRDPDAFRLMWHNREAKVEQIPIEIEALRCEQNKLLQQLKQNAIEPSPIIDNNTLKKQIDDLSKKIEQLTDEEKTLRRLIRKKNMRLRAKERQQQKQQTTVQDLILPSSDLVQNQQISESHTSDLPYPINIKDEKIEPSTNLSSPILKARKELSITTVASMAKSIDKRREEINDRSNKTTMVSSHRSPRPIQSKQSSSTTDIELPLDGHCHSEISPNIRTTIDNQEDIVESKSFIHNLDFNLHSSIQKNE